MSTSLAEQLRRLAAPQTSLLYDSIRRPSILFDPKEAAKKDRQTIYEIGYQGLMELVALSPAFLQFEQTLFDRTTMTFQRSVESSEVNQQLDKTIKRFFHFLSPYFMLKPAHMCIEWLLRRYHIHRFNKTEILQLIFPYHETKIFVRCVQLLKLKNTTDGWEWLLPIQRPGVPLSRSAVLNRAARDPAFLKFICESTVDAVKQLDARANTLQAQFAFYTTSIVGALEYANDIAEWHISTILESVLKGMSSKTVDFCAAAYMVAAQLVSKTQLSTKLLHGLLSKISKVEHARLHRAAVSLLVLIFQNQSENISSFSVGTLKNLTTHEWLPATIDTLAKQGALVSCLCSPLLGGCLQSVQRKTDNWQTLKLFIDNFLLIVNLRGSEAVNLIRCVLDNYCNVEPLPGKENAVIELDSDDDDLMIDGDISRWYADVLKQLEQKHPEEFERVLKETLQGRGKISDARREALKTALAFRLKSVYSEDNTAVYENLYHYNTHNRSEAVKFLVTNFGKLSVAKDDAVLKDSLLDRLSDDEPKVLNEILKLPTEHMINVLGIDLTALKLVEILYKRKPRSQKWGKVAANVFQHLLKPPLLHNDNAHRTILAVIPFLFPSTEQELAITKQILSSELVKTLPSFRKLKIEVVNAKDAETFAEVAEQALKSTDQLVTIDSLLKTFTDVRDSMSFLLLLPSAFKQGTREEVGVETMKQLLNINQKYKLVPLVDSQKCYQEISRNEISLQIFLNCLQLIAERTKCDTPQDLASKGLVVTLFEFLLVKAFTSTRGNGKAEYAATFSTVMNTLFPSFEAKLDFVADYFIQDCPYESDERLEIKIRAIRLFSIITANAKDKSALKKETFVKLLVALSDKVDLVRESVLKALEALSQSDLLPHGFDRLAQALLERSDEITLDEEQLPLILCIVMLDGKADKKMDQVLANLVDTVINDGTSNLLKSKTLNILKHINNPSVFKKLLTLASTTMDYVESLAEDSIVLDSARSSVLYHIIRKYDHSTVKLINEEASAWDFIKRLLKCQRIRSSHEYKPASIACTFMNVFDEALYNKLSEKMKRELIDEVVTALTFAEDPALTSAGNKFIKRISLNAKHLEPLLVRMKSACCVSSPNERKKCKRLIVNSEGSSIVDWKKGITLLELLQTKKNVEEFTSLIFPLIEILKICLEFEEQTTVEYPKQLVLSALLQCCQMLTEDKVALKSLQNNVFRVDLVVQCIRASQNPQTHHHALMLLSQCASLFPDQVLHNIMDIFTFMGSSVVRHDDAFSFQIITSIIESIVPTLVNLKTNEDKVGRVVSVMRVFSDITLDVPEHRRLPLYTKLLKTLDAKKFLWMFLCVLLESHVIHESKGKVKGGGQHRFSKESEMPKRVEFALQLIKDFDVEVALETCIALFTYLAKLPTNKDESKTVNDVMDETALFHYDVHSAKQLRHFKYVLVQVVSSFTSSPEFLNRIALLSEEENKAMKSFYQDFIIKVLCYVPQVTNAMEQHADTNQLQYWKVMLHHCYDVLENSISLLSPDLLLVVVQGLMQHKLPAVRKKVIEILISKLQYKADYFSQCNEEYLLNVLHSLNDLLDGIVDTHTNQTEMLYIQQSALIAIKLLSRFLAVKNVEEFKEVLSKLTRVLKRHDSMSKMVLAAVVLAITEICANLRAHAISQLSKFMPYVVEVLQGQSISLEEQVPDNVSIAIVTGVQKLIDTLPLFLGPYMVETISALVAIWVQLERHRNETRAGIIVNKLNAIWTRIGSTIPLRMTLSVFDKTYKKLIEVNQFLEIKFLMNLMNECLAKSSSEDIQSMQTEITDFYLEALNFRVKNMNKASPKDILAVEECILQSFVSLVLKLSESSFRPLYQKVYDWAMRNNQEKERTITYFLLSAKIAEALKSLFVLFASEIVTDAANLLENCNAANAGADLYFPGDEEKTTLLVENILKTLYRIFLHDSKSFVNEHRFDIIMQPIVDQLQNRLVLESKTLKDLLKSCISELAHALQNDSLWKRLNYQILLKTRNNVPEVRIVAISCCVEVAKKLGEQFVPLLPDTVPFIAELFEDEVEVVEKACRRGVQEMEKSLGISLQEYF